MRSALLSFAILLCTCSLAAAFGGKPFTKADVKRRCIQSSIARMRLDKESGTDTLITPLIIQYCACVSDSLSKSLSAKEMVTLGDYFDKEVVKDDTSVLEQKIERACTPCMTAMQEHILADFKRINDSLRDTLAH